MSITEFMSILLLILRKIYFLIQFGILHRGIFKNTADDISEELKCLITKRKVKMKQSPHTNIKEPFQNRLIPVCGRFRSLTSSSWLVSALILVLASLGRLGRIFEMKKVKMHSMIGPDEAFQIQTQEVLHETPDYTAIRVRIQTIDFPYSDTFFIDQM